VSDPPPPPAAAQPGTDSPGEQRLREVFDASPLGIVVLGPDKKFRTVSRAFAAMLGYEPGELVGQTYMAITHSDDLERNHQLVDGYFADEQATGYLLEKRYLHRTGSTVWVRVTARPYIDADTGARLALAIIEDITSRRQLDQARRDSERMLAAIWNCVVLIGADWRYRFVNVRAAAELERAAGELIGCTVWGRFPGAPNTRLAAAMREVMAGEHVGPVLIEEYVAAADRWYESTVSRCDDGIVVVWRDVTERKQAELTLRRALRLRDEFISVTSHELRTPLAALVLHLDLLARVLDRGAEPGQMQVRIRGALRQGERLTALVEELLDGTLLASGPLRLALTAFDARDLVHEVAERLLPRAVQSGCALNLPLGAPAVGAWDRPRLDRALSNLVGNAIKYGQRAPVDIEVRAGEDAVEIAVRDRGIGITEEARARIFGRFERAVPYSHYGGLGLGLYIAGQIVEAHGGTIDIDSIPGEGSTFVVHLPRRSATLGGPIA
jgi:PAS domain S-box-containing protein